MLSLPLFAAAVLAGPTAAPAAESLAAVSPSAVWAPGAYALKATRIHVGDGSVVENGVLVIDGGKVVSVGAKAPDGLSVTEVHGEIAPGFIALRDATGAGGENNETTRKFTPTADVSRAFDPHHPAWAHLVSQGVTTVLLTPSSSRIAGGMDAIVSPAMGEVVLSGAALHLGLSSRSLSSSVEPTSYAGLYAHLEKHFASPAEGSPFAAAKAGTLPVMMEALTRSEVVRAAEFAQSHGLKGAIVGAAEAGDLAEMLKGSGLGVVFEPMTAGGPADVVESTMALQEGGVPFAFASDANSKGASAMRMTAAACVRGGLEANDALKAMTHTPAMLLGVSSSHGTLGAGKVADFVVWSGAPTDLTSRATHVYAGGKLVHQLAHKASTSNR